MFARMLMQSGDGLAASAMGTRIFSVRMAVSAPVTAPKPSPMATADNEICCVAPSRMAETMAKPTSVIRRAIAELMPQIYLGAAP
jgi:hypothetical protein